IIESGLTLTNSVHGILPIVSAKQGLQVVPQPGQGPVSSLPIVPNGQKNTIISQVIPQISPGEKPLVNSQSQTNSVVPAPATPAVTPQQGTQANILSAAQVLAGAVLPPVKNELVGPAASRLENRRTSVSNPQSINSVASATGQNISATSSQPLVPVNGSGVAQSGQQITVVNNIIAAAVLNNSAAIPVAPIPVATVPVDTQSMVQSRASDFGLSLEPEVGSSTLASKSTSQSSIGQNAATANPALATKIGAETVSKFAARLAMRAVSGATKFEMRLDPPQLGRIEVKIAMTSDNRVQAVMIVENPEVFQDLQKGADSLRKALIREGFDLGSNDLEFQLSQENNGSEQQTDDSQGSVDNQVLAQIMAHTSSDDIPDIDTGYGYWLMSEQRIDIRA
ncbi:MAG: flagellar hook-length control protein FliK, partial [Robiginitomaculum sp.]|nr:flagellar hook-length control protein FliK [Robiginitomaculum sp.]